MIKRILVPNQNPKNTFKMTAGDSGCCGDGVTDCQYATTYTQANTVSALNILDEKGVAKVLPAVPVTTSAADVRTAIMAALVLAGYEDDNNLLQDGVTVVDNGATLTVTIIGNVNAVSLTHSGGTAVFVKTCTQTTQCTYTLPGYAGGTSPSAATVIRINGVNYDIGTVVAGTTTAVAVAAAIQAALTTSLAGGTVAVATVGTGLTQTYTVTITGSKSTNTIVLAGAYFVRSGCVFLYV